MPDNIEPTDFEHVVVWIIKTVGRHGSIDAYTLREELMARGMGKHPAGVAMNLTRVAWRERFFTCYVNDGNCRVFMLTSDGNTLKANQETKWLSASQGEGDKVSIDEGSPAPRRMLCGHTGCHKPAVCMHGVTTATHGYCLEHRTCERCGRWVVECECKEGPLERKWVRALIGRILDRHLEEGD